MDCGRALSPVYYKHIFHRVTRPFVTMEGKKEGRKEEYVLFNGTLFNLLLYGGGHMLKGHSDSERGNPLLPHGLLFPINRKGSFICTIPQTG